jgi:hypothetical protein
MSAFGIVISVGLSLLVFVIASTSTPSRYGWAYIAVIATAFAGPAVGTYLNLAHLTNAESALSGRATAVWATTILAESFAIAFRTEVAAAIVIVLAIVACALAKTTTPAQGNAGAVVLALAAILSGHFAVNQFAGDAEHFSSTLQPKLQSGTIVLGDKIVAMGIVAIAAAVALLIIFVVAFATRQKLNPSRGLAIALLLLALIATIHDVYRTFNLARIFALASGQS